MAEKFLSLSGMQTLWNKVKSVFATKTDLSSKTNFAYGRVFASTTYNSDKPYLLLASTDITFSGNWQETSEFLIRVYDGSAENRTRSLKIQLSVGGLKTAISYGACCKKIYQINLTDEQASAIRIRYTFTEGSCKFWIYFDRTKIQTRWTCIHIQPESIGKGDRSNTISNGLNYWSLKNYSSTSLPEMEVGVMEGENELEFVTTEIIASIAAATKATQDENGNNIANTYATKEALNSANQNIAGLTSGLGSKLQADGSNANSTTTNNIFEAAAGGASDSYTIEDNTQILLKDEGDTARKYYLSKFIDYLRSKLIRDSFSPPTSTNVAPTVGAVTTVIENKEKNLKETYFDAAPISISKDVETAILEIPYSSAPDLYQRIYELNISSNIAHQTNFKIIFCPAVNSSKSFTTNTRAYILGFSTDTTRGLFRFCTTNSGVVLTCKYTSDNSSSNTRQIAISMNIARGTGFTKVNKPITDYGTITSSFYLTNTTYVKSYVTSDDLDNKLYNTITEYNNGAFDAYGYASLPIVCKPYVYTAETTKSASEWITTCIPSSMITNGRSFILVNPSNVTYKISGLANSSTYSLNSNLSMIIVYCNNKYYRQTV